jgi:hypothetical protein
MEKFLQKFKKLRNLIVFDPGEKAAGRERLASYLRGAEAVRAQNVIRLSSYKSPLLTIIKNRYMPIFASILILALLGSGTSFAAEGALPGDLLYPVKIKVNEQVATALAFSTKDKARLDANLAAKRLAETAELAAKGRLSGEVEIELEHSFQASADRAEKHIRFLEDSGDDNDDRDATEIRLEFENVLQTRAKLLQEILSQASSTTDLEQIFSAVDLILNSSSSVSRHRRGSDDGLNNDNGSGDDNSIQNSEVEIEFEHGVPVIEVKSGDGFTSTSVNAESSDDNSDDNSGDDSINDSNDDDGGSHNGGSSDDGGSDGNDDNGGNSGSNSGSGNDD